MADKQPTPTDTTSEERTGDSNFLPVVVAAGVALIVILVAALIFIKSRQTKAIPTPHEAHPTSQFHHPPIQLPLRPSPTLAA
jgi:cell division protein FtsN